MKQMRNISVKPNVLESLIPHMPLQNDGNRYQLSYAVRQLARMGAYNEAGGLPLAIRLEATGDFTELYETCDRLICPVDSADADLLNADSMVDALVRCAVFLVRSRKEEMVGFHVMVPSKGAENAPEKLADWAVPDTCIKKFTEKIETLKSAGVLRENTPTDTLFSSVADKLTIQHVRRRHGYLGKESLMGLELEAVKVLEDAGINGSDLSAALANLAAHAAGKHVEKKKTGLLFDRSDAVLLIRDHQRRARIQRPGVQVVDVQFLDRTQPEPQLLPRNPGWKNVVDASAVKRNLFESAVRWARLAALKSGRGLLPIFYFTGEEGSGRSFLLKQVAWELYKEGFAVAEIVNLEEAAKEAESLAAAAVALDAPLILVWDDAYEPGVDVLQAFREFAEAQVSGVPVMILSASSDLGYNAKKIRQISRTSFEEFEVHCPDETELQDDVPAEKKQSPDPQIIAGDTAADLQSQKTDQFTILVSKQVTEPRGTMLEAVVTHHEKMSLDTYAGALNDKILKTLGETRPVYDLICDLGMVGFPLPEKLATMVFDAGRIGAFKAVLEKNDSLAIKKYQTPEGWMWECGHPVLVRALGRIIRNSGSGSSLEKAITCMIREPEFQSWAARFMRALYSSHVLPSDVLEALTHILISAIAEKTVRISPVVLSDFHQLAATTENESFQSAVVDALADYARLNTTDSFVALTPLLRNRMGGLEDADTLEILKAAKPDEDRVAFKFLLKFLSDHQPNDLREASVDNARTAAARAPDQGFAVAAYLRFCWSRGTEEQINRSIEETRSWLDTTPDDRVVRRAFMDYVVAKGSDELKRESIEPLEDWLENHVDEGPLRNSLIELAFALNDPPVTDRVLEDIARWIEQRGNNRSVRHNYFRRAEKRNDTEIMKRACDVAVSWLNNHGDDRETVQSLLFIAGRLGEKGFNPSVFNAIHSWLTAHVMERDLLRRYLLLADRAGKGRAITHAVEAGLNWIQDNPDDTEVREILLGMTARKVDRKIQIRVYDTNAQWLESLQEPDPMMEYMIGRLGVRAGIARRTIPLLERAVARSEGELRNHARLWLGSAYRVAEAYLDARNVWQAVKDDGIPEMVDRADRNLGSLELHLKEKFPEGYPPPSEKAPPKHRPPRGPRKDTATVPDLTGQVSAVPGHRDEKRRDPDFKRPVFPKAPAVQRFAKGQSQKPAAKPEATPKKVATLGDLMRMKGLDLTKLPSSKDKK